MMVKKYVLIIVVIVGLVIGFIVLNYSSLVVKNYYSKYASSTMSVIPLQKLNISDYNKRLLALAHRSSTVSTSTTKQRNASTTQNIWPVKTTYPDVGAILPFKRIVAYYGNFYSKKMGVLGEYPLNIVLAKLASTTKEWNVADPTTPVIPAIQYIAVVAQGTAGKEGEYILRMPDTQIEYALNMANRIHGLLILDLQVGQSTLQRELPLLKKYLALPQVELAIDPEFSMKYGEIPGTVIGTYDATNINYAVQYLATLVRKYHLPPKVLIVHRFTKSMVTNYKDIKPLPEVEIVMDMDGWGSPKKKIGTYNLVIYPEPVQFAGIKIFYKADLRAPSTQLLAPKEVLRLTPSPIYIQYQ